MIAEHNPDRMMSDRSVVRTGFTSQHRTRGEQGIVRPGHGERQENFCARRHVPCIRISRHHSDNARQSPTPIKLRGSA